MVKMREIEVVINEDGSVKILYKGFRGGACFEEAKKLYQQLKSLGVNVKIEQVVPTQEAYQTTTSKTREVEKL